MAVRIGLWWALFMASVKMFVRNRLALFFSLFLPLVIMLIFGVLNFEGSTSVSLGVVDEARTDASAALVDGLDEYDYLEITEGTRDDELAALEKGDRGFVLVIPSGYQSRTPPAPIHPRRRSAKASFSRRSPAPCSARLLARCRVCPR